jgi:hypothetical protein
MNFKDRGLRSRSFNLAVTGLQTILELTFNIYTWLGILIIVIGASIRLMQSIGVLIECIVTAHYYMYLTCLLSHSHSIINYSFGVSMSFSSLGVWFIRRYISLRYIFRTHSWPWVEIDPLRQIWIQHDSTTLFILWSADSSNLNIILSHRGIKGRIPFTTLIKCI